jgi:hypothetical protein
MPNPQNPRWLDALPALFGIGAAMGGAPTVGTAAIAGAEQGKARELERQQIQTQESQRQQQLDLQSQAMLAQEAARQAQAEERKQSALKAAVDDLRVQKFTTKADYDAAVAFRENLIGQTYGQLRPNTLRYMVPYNGPTAESRARDAMETITKQKNWQDIVTSNGTILFARDDEHPDIKTPVPILELAEIAKFPIARNVDGQPMLPPKEVKPENVEQFDVAYKGVLEEWKAEGKNIADPAVQGKAVQEALKRNAAASKQGNASVVVNMPERPMTRGQRFDAEVRLRNEATKTLEPIREMNRQVTVMRAGLDHALRTKRLDAGTQAVINTFNRVMEPGSVTREAEYLRSTMGQPLFESLQGRWQAIFQGGAGVRPETLHLIVELSEEIADKLQASAEEPLRMISETATEFQIPSERVVPNPASYRLKPRTKPAAPAGNDLRERARQILREGKYDTSDASVDKFLANPKNKALLGGGQ